VLRATRSTRLIRKIEVPAESENAHGNGAGRNQLSLPIVRTAEPSGLFLGGPPCNPIGYCVLADSERGFKFRVKREYVMWRKRPTSSAAIPALVDLLTTFAIAE
jgi:hypothetical protein